MKNLSELAQAFEKIPENERAAQACAVAMLQGWFPRLTGAVNAALIPAPTSRIISRPVELEAALDGAAKFKKGIAELLDVAADFYMLKNKSKLPVWEVSLFICLEVVRESPEPVVTVTNMRASWDRLLECDKKLKNKVHLPVNFSNQLRHWESKGMVQEVTRSGASLKEYTLTPQSWANAAKLIEWVAELREKRGVNRSIIHE